MLNSLPRRQLASRLAGIGREIKTQHGDLAAQVLTYGALLSRWEPRARLPELLVPCHEEFAQRVSAVLEEIDLDAVASSCIAADEEPAIYFYPDFLRAYDPPTARNRGVHYSPPSVVSYIVRAVDDVLHDQFGHTLSEAVVLDPCCGIGTFLRYIEKHFDPPPRMIGMELCRGAAALASALLRSSEVVNADSLDDMDLDLKGRTLVIVGNPPYSGHSANPGKTRDRLADYQAGLNERNPKWLQDDYVKFIRMAQARVDAAGMGIVAFITNHSFIFNPTFRAMRASLMQTFDSIHILDLHGNAKRVERNGAEPDENVFPIQMGVAVSLMVKTSDRPRCRVMQADLRGLREQKLSALGGMRFRDTPWRTVETAGPFFLFTPSDRDLQAEYQGFISILDLFHERSVGFVTSRDSFAVDFDRDALLGRIAMLRDPRVAPEWIRANYPVGDLDIETARRALQSDMLWEEAAVRVLYRPFDHRWAYLSRAVMERPRLPFMDNLVGENVAIAVGRAGQVTGSDTWDVVFCTNCPADLNLFRRGGAMLFPRYVYDGGVRQSNLAAPGGSTLFNFIYAILYSRAYRARYADFLAVDYPRIPIPSDTTALRPLAELGDRLMQVHLLRSALPVLPGLDDGPRMTIGGYDLPASYLKTRKRRALTDAEIAELARIQSAIAETLAIQKRIDQIAADQCLFRPSSPSVFP